MLHGTLRPLLKRWNRETVKKEKIFSRFTAHVPAPRGFGEVQLGFVSCIVLLHRQKCADWRRKALHVGCSRTNSSWWCIIPFSDQA